MPELNLPRDEVDVGHGARASRPALSQTADTSVETAYHSFPTFHCPEGHSHTRQCQGQTWQGDQGAASSLSQRPGAAECPQALCRAQTRVSNPWATGPRNLPLRSRWREGQPERDSGE